MIINVYKSKIQEKRNIRYKDLMESLSKEIIIETRTITTTVSEYKKQVM